MLNAFLINASILIALISTAYLLFHAGREFFLKHPRLARVMLGLFAGATGTLLMNQSYLLGNGMYIDFRNFTIGISAIFGGITATVITAGILLTYRLVTGGFTQITIALMVALLALSVGSILIAKRTRVFTLRWIFCCVLNFAISAVSLYYFLHHDQIPIVLYIYFFVGNILIAAIIYMIMKHFVHFDRRYSQLAVETKTDYLTTLYNVRGFDSAFNKAINWTTRKNERLSFLMIDIDHFKKVNDTLGHLAGDQILRQLAAVLVNSSRSFDVVSRNGGEEFSVILQDCPPDHAVEVAERIRVAVDSHDFKIGHDSVKLTVSIGVAAYPDQTDSPEDLISLADKALYEAKQSGRNKVVMYCSG